MSTLAELLNADLKEESYRLGKYWKSSSLPALERRKHKPLLRKSPRDRVIRKLIGLNTNRFSLAVIARFNLQR